MSFNSVLFEECCSLECNAVSSINILQTFQKNLLPPSSCRRGTPTEYRHMPHGVTCQETELLTVTPVGTSDITCLLLGGRTQWKPNSIRDETPATLLLLVTRKFMNWRLRPQSTANAALPPSARNVDLQSLDFCFTFSHSHDPPPNLNKKKHSFAKHSNRLPIMLQMRVRTPAWNSKREKQKLRVGYCILRTEDRHPGHPSFRVKWRVCGLAKATEGLALSSQRGCDMTVTGDSSLLVW